MTEAAHRSGITWTGRTYWRVLGVLSLGLVVVSGVVLGPFGVTSYVGGLLNLGLIDLGLIVMMCWGLLILVSGVQAVRRSFGKQKLRAVFWLVVLAGLVAPVPLAVARVGPPPIDWFIRGFERYVERRTDIDAIQTWVSAVDANDFGGLAPSRSKHHLTGQELPPAVARLNERPTLELDDAGRPMVRFRWLSTKTFVHGLVVGRKDMPTPPSDHSMYGERRYELRPGVYFWFRER